MKPYHYFIPLFLIIGFTSLSLSGCAFTAGSNFTDGALRKKTPYPQLKGYGRAYIDKNNVVHIPYIAIPKDNRNKGAWCASIPFESVRQNFYIAEYKYDKRTRYIDKASLDNIQAIDRSAYEIKNESCDVKNKQDIRPINNGHFSYNSDSISPSFYSNTDIKMSLYHSSDLWFNSEGEKLYLFYDNGIENEVLVAKMESPVLSKRRYNKKKILALPYYILLDTITFPFQLVFFTVLAIGGGV